MRAYPEMHAAPPPAIVEHVTVRRDSVTFVFDRPPQRVRTGYVPRSQLADCGSGARVRLPGTAWVVIHFLPARSAHRMGPYPTAARVCDFESDVAWAIARPARQRYRVSRAGSTVTISFGG